MELRLKEIREKQDISQRQMAKILKISKSYYNYFESGERIITLRYLNDFCNLYHYTFDYVLGLTSINTHPKKKITIDPKLVGKRIKEIRKENKLKQRDLAEMINTSQSTVSSYENGNTLILTAFLYEIAVKLNVSADYLVGRSNTKKIILPKLD